MDSPLAVPAIIITPFILSHAGPCPGSRVIKHLYCRKNPAKKVIERGHYQA